MSAFVSARNLLLAVLLLVTGATVALAGSGYESCVAEEKRLRATEVEQCNGLGYIFNPSACFNTRKALGPYSRGKCREIAVKEGVTLPEAVKPAGSDKPVAAGTDAAAAAAPAEQSSRQPVPKVTVPAGPETVSAPAESNGVQTAGDAAVYDPRTEIEMLKKELAGLKAEVLQLKDEISQLRQR